MPELPEIETVKLQLQKVLVGEKLEGYAVYSPRSLQGDLEKFKGQKIIAIRRKAKVLLVDFTADLTLAFHFKMTGQLILDRDKQGKTYTDRIVGGHPTEDFVGKLPSVHTRLAFKFPSGLLYFNDQRLFGWAKAGKTEDIEKEKFLQGLGPEPFVINDEEFIARVTKSRRPIKLVLLDQTVISGVGNIYANDALWEAQIHPQTPANTLSSDQLKKLFKGVLKVLSEGIKYGGATAANYVNLHGLGGKYQDHFRTYDRTGKKCLRTDGGIVKKFVLGGRGTYYCPVCQKL